MSLADDAKLLLIPTAYNTSKVYSVFPTDGDGDFTYIRSGNASRVNPGGLIETVSDNIPRIDHFGGGCPTLLLEPQRTNLYYDSTGWNGLSKVNITFTDTTNIIAPDGTVDDVKLMTATSTNQPRFDEAISVPGIDKKYTTSVFVKKNTGRYVSIGHFSDSINAAIFDLDNGSIHYQHPLSLGLAKIENYGNGWYRISLPMQITAGAAYNVHKILLSDGVNWYTGTVGDSIYCWGFQIEEGEYLTSYIKTSGSIMTRYKDECINGGDSDLFDITEGTFFVDTTPFTREATDRITLSNNGYNNRILISKSSSTQLQFIIVSDTETVATYTTNITYNVRNKIAFTFKENEFKFYLNGSLVHTDTSGSVPTGLNDLSFKGIGSALYWSGKVYDTRVYDYVLSEEEAIKLTS